MTLYSHGLRVGHRISGWAEIAIMARGNHYKTKNVGQDTVFWFTNREDRDDARIAINVAFERQLTVIDSPSVAVLQDPGPGTRKPTRPA